MKAEIKNSAEVVIVGAGAAGVFAEVVIVGAGAAGLFAALSLAPQRVIVLSEKPLGGICASCWAQGGIAAAVDKEDTVASHAADTMKAAAGTADAEGGGVLPGEGPRC